MRYWSRKSRASFRTTPCPMLIWPISNLIPTVLQHPYQLYFHHRCLPQFQILPTGNLQVTYPQPCPIRFHHTALMRSLSQIHPFIPVNIKVLSLTYLHPHPQGYHFYHPHRIHLIKPTLLLCNPQVYLYLQLQLQLLTDLKNIFFSSWYSQYILRATHQL